MLYLAPPVPVTVTGFIVQYGFAKCVKPAALIFIYKAAGFIKLREAADLIAAYHFWE